MLNNKTLKQGDIDHLLSLNYDNRICLIGEYMGMRCTALFYCHDCSDWFFQKFESISRGFATRCSCEPETWRLKDKATWCTSLKEWDCYDRIIPKDVRRSP